MVLDGLPIVAPWRSVPARNPTSDRAPSVFRTRGPLPATGANVNNVLQGACLNLVVVFPLALAPPASAAAKGPGLCATRGDAAGRVRLRIGVAYLIHWLVRSREIPCALLYS